MKIKTLRQALDAIEDMLSDKPYSSELWNVLVALRGPDSRNRKIKYATTAVIRSRAFPSQPCLEYSVFGKDSKKSAKRRRSLFANREDNNHFREHVHDAFKALGLKLFEVNDKQSGEDFIVKHLRKIAKDQKRGQRCCTK